MGSTESVTPLTFALQGLLHQLLGLMQGQLKRLN